MVIWKPPGPLVYYPGARDAFDTNRRYTHVFYGLDQTPKSGIAEPVQLLKPGFVLFQNGVIKTVLNKGNALQKLTILALQFSKIV